MARKRDKEGAKKRILSTSVRLFLEQGYSNTSPTQIVKEADVTVGSFYNIFKSKSDVLTSLCEFMFENQFDIATEIVGKDVSGPMVYAVETSIQLTLAELNENIRDIYLEVYTDPDLLDLVQHKTTKELGRLFGKYLPENRESDFYEMEIGSAGVMRGYMAKKCDMYFSLEQKLKRFLWISLVIYKVPENEIRQIVDAVLKLDIRNVAASVMHHLFLKLEMVFDFQLSEDEL
jgi:AcrR family transcriptional regulator